MLIQAEEALRKKKTEYRYQRRLKQHLVTKVDLLAALEGQGRIPPNSTTTLISSSSSVDSGLSTSGSLLHDLAMRTISARMTRSVRETVVGLELSKWSIAFESLPLSMEMYTEELVIRTAEMGVGDEVHIYRGFLNR